MNIADEMLDHTVRHQVGIEGYKRRVVGEILRMVQGVHDKAALRLIKKDIQSLGVRDLSRLLKVVDRDIKNGYKPIISKITKELKDIAPFEAGFQADMLRSTIPVAVDFVAPATAQIFAAASARPFNGFLLKDWLSDLDVKAATEIKRVIREGFTDGRTTQQIVRTITGTRTTNGVATISKRKAEATVRTAINHTASVARDEVYKENSNIVDRVQWVSTLDGRTSAICQSRDGKTWPMNEGPRPPAHINCLPPDTLVTSRYGITGATKHRFDGQLVVIRTASGKELTSTPNHPVLTSIGWVAANQISKGNNVICDGGAERVSAATNMDYQDMPARIEDIAEAFFSSSGVVAVPVPTTTEDFHGDGMNGDVAIVATNGLLYDRLNPALFEKSNQSALVLGNVGLSVFARFSGLASMLFGVPYASDRIMSGFRKLTSLLRCSVSHTCILLLRSVSNMNAVFFKDALNDIGGDTVRLAHATSTDTTGIFRNDCGSIGVNLTPVFGCNSRLAQDTVNDFTSNTKFARRFRDTQAGIVNGENATNGDSGFVSAHLDLVGFDDFSNVVIADAKLSAEIINGSTGPVFSDDVVSVKRVNFSGHVYNLETEKGFYTAGGIITHNCRSTTIPIIKSWKQLGINLKEAPIGTRASMDGQVSADLTYPEWLKKKPAKFQDEVLGRTKGKLFRDGMPIDKFVSRAGTERTLDQLKAANAEAFSNI